MERVLIVADDANVAIPLSEELEAHGFDVARCWGPRPPDFVCGGARCGTCALAERADVVVVDGWLASDAARSGVPSDHLVMLYRSMGLPVVALEGPNGSPGPVTSADMVVLSRDASTTAIATAVERLLVHDRADRPTQLVELRIHDRTERMAR